MGAGYDSRGNITTFPGKNLHIKYNLNNLPQSIAAADGKKTNYSYMSDGTKFRAVSETGVNYLYTGSLRWRIQDGTITPESFAVAGGRATFDGNGWQTHYYITDHLGSTRAVTNASGDVLATFDYTPYGELLAASDSTTAGTDYLFTGKENQAKQGVGELYDSQARFMDTGGRFLSIDPLAEKYYHLSPYTYCAGDPVNLVDPEGELPDFFWDVFNVGIGLYSLGKNLIEGNFVDACVDLGGVVVDAAAAAIPILPGGVGTTIKAARAGDDIVDAAKIVNKADDVIDAGKAINKSAVPQKITKKLRSNLIKATGIDPKDMDAHHMLPQKFKDKIEEASIDINNPQYGIWLEKRLHSKRSYKYNKNWEEFFTKYKKINSKPTAEEIITFMKQVMKETFNIDIQ